MLLPQPLGCWPAPEMGGRALSPLPFDTTNSHHHHYHSSPSLSFITTIITIRDILSHSAGVSGPDTSASASRLLARGRKERTEIVTPRIKYYHPLPPTPPFITTIHHHRATARPRCFNINIFDFVLFTFLCDTDQSVSL